MTAAALQAYVRRLKDRNEDNSFEPDFDDKDEKKDRELRYDVSLASIRQAGWYMQQQQSHRFTEKARI